MEQIIKSATRVQHLAGIVPIAGQPLGFNMPWHDAMMPIAPDYLAVERAVYECVLVGCTTIWIVCHVGTQPLLRKRIGDYVCVPKNSLYKRTDKVSNNKANIFYIPIHPKDRDKRDCLGWSVLYGADRAYCLCKFISRWTIPEKFYCAFPYGIGPNELFKENKELILSDKQVIFSYQDKTVKEGLYTSFTFNAEDFKKARDIVKKYPSVIWGSTINIPVSVKNSAIAMSLEQIFINLDTDAASVVEYPWFYGIGNWGDYSKFIGAGIPLIKDKAMFLPNKRENV